MALADVLCLLMLRVELPYPYVAWVSVCMHITAVFVIVGIDIGAFYGT